MAYHETKLSKLSKLTKVSPELRSVLELGGAYVAWIAVHAAAANGYTYLCAPATFTGILTSPFFAPAPHCRALLWATNTGAAGIDAMWISLGTWLSAKMFVKIWK